MLSYGICKAVIHEQKPSTCTHGEIVSYLLRPKGISLIPLTQMVCWGGGDNEEACSYISLNRVGLSILMTMIMVPSLLRSVSLLRWRASGQINSISRSADKTESCLCSFTLLSLVIFWPVFFFFFFLSGVLRQKKLVQSQNGITIDPINVLSCLFVCEWFNSACCSKVFPSKTISLFQKLILFGLGLLDSGLGYVSGIFPMNASEIWGLKIISYPLRSSSYN